MMERLIVSPGTDKNGRKEPYDRLVFSVGELWAIVGSTGSGKSRFIQDLELLVQGDSVSHRTVRAEGAESGPLMAHLGQGMRFVLDLTVEEFLRLHGAATGKQADCRAILERTNTLTEEPVAGEARLSELSGGQSRALMVADIAALSDRPVVLADEIENAGIDKEAALALLTGRNKLVFLVTHDPHTALLASGRLVMKNGAVTAVRTNTPGEKHLFARLDAEYRERRRLLALLREGAALA